MTKKEKAAKSIHKKPPNLVKKPKIKTKRSFNKIVDRKVVKKRLSIKNLLIRWETEEE